MSVMLEYSCSAVVPILTFSRSRVCCRAHGMPFIRPHIVRENTYDVSSVDVNLPKGFRTKSDP